MPYPFLLGKGALIYHAGVVSCGLADGVLCLSAQNKTAGAARRKQTMHLTRYEQETIINYNAGEDTATIYTRDPAVMRKVDALVNAFPTVYKLIRATDYDRTYEVPKSYINYRKPRNLSDEQRERARQRMVKQNKNTTRVERK